MKRKLALCLITALTAAFLCTGLAACGGNKNDGVLEYQLNYGETGYVVQAIIDDTATQITIPSTFNDKPVVSISTTAFRDNTTITSITLSENITKILQDTFNGCTSLTSITIPANVTEIDNTAFCGCSALTSVTFSSGSKLEKIGNNAFNSCAKLKNITIPSTVTSIGFSAFSGCTSLTSINIPSSVTYIGKSAFSSCSALTEVNFANASGWYLSNTLTTYSADNCKLLDETLGSTTAAKYLTDTYKEYNWLRA